jgi:hypothetical protein
MQLRKLGCRQVQTSEIASEPYNKFGIFNMKKINEK